MRAYEQALVARILPDLGGARLSEIRREDVQDLADRLVAEGRDPSTIRNALMPLRATFRRATARGEVAVNPTTGVELPAVRGKRDRIASPTEAAQLLAALPESDRALWASAMYAGLRRGELMALRWDDVDLEAGVIRVERSWDPKSGEYVAPKSASGVRSVPIARVLREMVIAHRVRTGRSEGLVFGESATAPWRDTTIRNRAERTWRAKKLGRAKELAAADGLELEQLSDAGQRRYLERAGFDGIGLHEARHTFASLMIAAGVNAKALSSYMGHSSITITLDRYGHLMPGNEEQAAGLLDNYLDRAMATSGRPG